MPRLAAIAALLASLPGLASAGGYVKRATARETYEASLAAEGTGVKLGPWHYIGPFDHTDGKGFDAEYPPESGVDLAAEYEGKGGQALRWQRGDSFKDNEVNSLRIFGDDDWIAVYLYRTLDAPREQDLPVLFGSDDALTVWLNGERLLHHNVSRHCRLGDEKATLHLEPDRNELLLKICQGGGGSGFAFGLDEQEGTLLERIAADFPDEVNDLLVELDWLRQARAIRRAEGPGMRPEDDAPGGCDGIANGQAGFHTDLEAAPWWQVDLGETQLLGRAVLYNRESCAERNNVLIIQLSDDGESWRTAWQNDGTFFLGHKDGKPLTASLGGERARYVRLTLPGTNYLHLDEVEVYGPDSATNLALSRPATQSTASNWSTYTPLPAGDGAATFRAATLDALDLSHRTLEFVRRAGGKPDVDASLADLSRRAAEAGPGADWQALYLDIRRLRRRIALSHPLLAFDDLLLVKRPPPLYSHMVDQYEGRHSRPGDGLVILSNWREAPQPKVLLEGKLPTGSVLHPDLSFDGGRVLFGFCDHTVEDLNARQFFIHEADLRTGELRQLTGVPGVDPLDRWEGRETVVIEDFDPCYLPGGGFVFVSTRNQAFGRCHGGRYTPAYVLYRADADGSNIRRLSYSEANEWDPSVLPNGSIIYTRWDYINRVNTFFQSLWTTLPDGAGVAHYYKNNTRNPCMTAEARSIPGSDSIVTTAMAHHSYTAGSLITVDRGRGEEGLEPVERITPDASFPETEGWPLGSYSNPWPLSKDLYLAAYSPDPLVSQGSVQRANAYGVYLVDTLGGRELLYRDPATSCFSPIPVQARPEPPVLASALEPDREDGTFLIQDVYRCVEPLEPGSVKRLRVVRIHEQPTAACARRGAVEHEVVKSVLGTVPVESDGSVAFTAPARMPLLFQLIDERNVSLFSMRSQVYLQPGETMSCIGCHEHRGTAPPEGYGLASASVREIDPPPGPRYEGGLSFPRTVQPVLDRYCIRCHGLEKREADLSLLGTHEGQFSESYNALVGRPGLVALAHVYQETDVSAMGDYGARGGQLASHLLTAHRERAPLDRGSFTRIAQWLDLNGQYYGDYAFEKPERREPSPESVQALRAHIQGACNACHAGMSDQPLAALANTAMPSESRVLLAPLSEASGGWGQCENAWPDSASESWAAMRNLVRALTTP